MPDLEPDAQRAWLRTVFHSPRVALIGKNLDGRIELWGRGAEEMYGWTAPEVIGEPIERMVPPAKQGELREILECIARGEQVGPVQTERVAKDGSIRYVSLTVSPVRDRGNAIIGAVALAHDISGHLAIEAELRRAKDRAEEASRTKDRFLAALSHELRTPLSPVVVATSVLAERNDLPDEVREQVALIRRNVELEARLIDDLLDLTRVSSGKLHLDRELHDPEALLRDAIDICAEALERRKLEVGVEAEGAEAVLEGDGARLRQVLWNLLQNAAKFSPEGGRIHTRVLQEGDQVVFEVADHGVGIAPERLENVFEAFEQGQPAATAAGGLGLGLAISKALVEAHGGTIEAESPGEGFGSTFRVRLPAGATGARTTPRPIAPTPFPQEDDQPLRILLVEDHEDTALLLRSALARRGHRVVLAHSVRDALASAPDGFDLIVSDLGLPDGSGTDMLRALRERGDATPAIALSGYGMEADMQRSRDAGFGAHLVKPVGLGRLLGTIEELLER